AVRLSDTFSDLDFISAPLLPPPASLRLRGQEPGGLRLSFAAPHIILRTAWDATFSVGDAACAHGDASCVANESTTMMHHDADRGTMIPKGRSQTLRGTRNRRSLHASSSHCCAAGDCSCILHRRPRYCGRSECRRARHSQRPFGGVVG